MGLRNVNSRCRARNINILKWKSDNFKIEIVTLIINLVACLKKADPLALVCDVNCVFVTFPCGILGQVWYLVVSIPDRCHLSYLVFRVFRVVLSVPSSLVFTCLESADLLALLCVMFSCVFVTFPYGVLGQVYLIVSIPDCFLCPYFKYQRYLFNYIEVL